MAGDAETLEEGKVTLTQIQMETNAEMQQVRTASSKSCYYCATETSQALRVQGAASMQVDVRR